MPLMTKIAIKIMTNILNIGFFLEELSLLNTMLLAAEGAGGCVENC